MKKAYQWSVDEGMAGPFLHRLMHSIFYANKRVVQETAFRDGAASVAYVATDLAKKFIPNFQKPSILVLGLGELGKNIAENLDGVEADIHVSNRTWEKAEQLQSRLNVIAVPFEKCLDRILSLVSK